MAHIAVDPDDATPPYRQIRAAILAAVAAGQLRPGDRLPSVRQLAGDLGVAVNTVHRAYAELERDGVVVASGRRGTRVVDAPISPTDPELRALARDFVSAALELGSSPEQILTSVTSALADRRHT